MWEFSLYSNYPQILCLRIALSKLEMTALIFRHEAKFQRAIALMREVLQNELGCQEYSWKLAEEAMDRLISSNSLRDSV